MLLKFEKFSIDKSMQRYRNDLQSILKKVTKYKDLYKNKKKSGKTVKTELKKIRMCLKK